MTWLDRLRAAAADPLGGVTDPRAFIAAFTDDAGHRRSVDRPFLAHLLGIHPGPRPATTADALWWAIHSDAPIELPPPGSPLVSPDGLVLETWTEAELSSLHAASHLAARGRADPARIATAARWVIENIQPDNATGHPWAIHVFARLGVPEADLYAQTLLHNTLVAGRGRPDRFSACILLDSARALAQANDSTSRS